MCLAEAPPTLHNAHGIDLLVRPDLFDPVFTQQFLDWVNADCSTHSTSESERMHSAPKRKTTPNHNEASENREVHDDNHHHRTKPAKRQRSENQEVDDHIDPLMQKEPHTILRNCSIVIG